MAEILKLEMCFWMKIMFTLIHFPLMFLRHDPIDNNSALGEVMGLIENFNK